MNEFLIVFGLCAIVGAITAENQGFNEHHIMNMRVSKNKKIVCYSYQPMRHIHNEFNFQTKRASGWPILSRSKRALNQPEMDAALWYHLRQLNKNPENCDEILRKIDEDLLMKGASVNAIDKTYDDGNTPLHYASSEIGNLENAEKVVEFLLERKADITITNKYAQPPLEWAYWKWRQRTANGRSLSNDESVELLNIKNLLKTENGYDFDDDAMDTDDRKVVKDKLPKNAIGTNRESNPVDTIEDVDATYQASGVNLSHSEVVCSIPAEESEVQLIASSPQKMSRSSASAKSIRPIRTSCKLTARNFWISSKITPTKR